MIPRANDTQLLSHAVSWGLKIPGSISTNPFTQTQILFHQGSQSSFSENLTMDWKLCVYLWHFNLKYEQYGYCWDFGLGRARGKIQQAEGPRSLWEVVTFNHKQRELICQQVSTVATFSQEMLEHHCQISSAAVDMLVILNPCFLAKQCTGEWRIPFEGAIKSQVYMITEMGWRNAFGQSNAISILSQWSSQACCCPLSTWCKKLSKRSDESRTSHLLLVTKRPERRNKCKHEASIV